MNLRQFPRSSRPALTGAQESSRLRLSGLAVRDHAKAPLSLEVDQGPQKRLSRRGASASRPSCTHKPPRDILRYPALMICNPSLRNFLCSEARHQRGVTTGHDHSVGRIFLSDDPVGSAGARMFSCHVLHIVFDCGNAKMALGQPSGARIMNRFSVAWT